MAMYIYSGNKPAYIRQLKAISSDIKQVWLADDAPSAVNPYFWTTILIPPQWL